MIIKNPLYKITAKENFFTSLACGIISKLSPVCKLKDVIILLPTKLACQSLREEFLKLKKPIPQIYPISDLSSLIKIETKYLDRIPLINKISKIILSLQLEYLQDIKAVTELAEYLADLLSKAESYKINLNNFLDIIDNDTTLHKQTLCTIIKEFIKEWNKNYSLTKAGYNNILIDTFANSLSDKPIVIAGINSNLPSIIELTTKMLHRQNNYIILYGIDEHLTPIDWNNVNITHSQYNFKNLFNLFNIGAKDVLAWHEESKKNSPFVSMALKPSQSCYDWHKNSYLDLENISFINAIDQHNEAKTIISLIQKNLDKSIMIVTPDNNLMIKLILHIEALSLEANIIRDFPLNQSKASTWLILCLNFILDKFSLLSGLALLKHPFSNIDTNILNELEATIRNKNFRSNSIFDAMSEDTFLERLKLEAKAFENIDRYSNFNSFLSSHLSFAEKITDNNLWEDACSLELKKYLDHLLENSEGFGNIAFRDYPVLFNHFLKSAYYREPTKEKKKITLLKPLDARLHNADLVILAGLNEGIWPAKASIDPCFNDQMLKNIGLPALEQFIGEEAYDFQCLSEAKEVILIRSEKIEAVSSIPSRWFLRMLILSRKSILESYKEVNINEQIIENSFIPPTPDIIYRPKKLSVTQIEKLIANPYHVYVDLILNLKKLSPLIKELSSLDFGNFIHKALEIYHYNHTRFSLIESGNQALLELRINAASVKLLWWPKFIRIADWFIANRDLSQKAYIEIPGSIKLLDNFMLTAKADRIELLPSNFINIIDYKTGKLTTNKAIHSGKSLQLLLEGIIAVNGGFSFQNITKKYQLGSIKYIQLSGAEDPAEILEIDTSDKPILSQTQNYIENLIKEYQNPLIPYNYTEKKTLTYCYYEHLARAF